MGPSDGWRPSVRGRARGFAAKNPLVQLVAKTSVLGRRVPLASRFSGSIDRFLGLTEVTVNGFGAVNDGGQEFQQ